MTDWRQLGWCDRCEITLDNGLDGDGVVCPDCGFDSRAACEERLREEEREKLPCTCEQGTHPAITIIAGCPRHDECYCAECVPDQQPYPLCFRCQTMKRLGLAP